MKNAGIAVKKRWKAFSGRDYPAKDRREAPWFIRENYRSGISLKPDQLMLFEEQIGVTNAVMRYGKIEKIRKALEAITDTNVNKEVWARINAIANKGGYVNHIGTISDVIDLIVADERGDIFNNISAVVKAGSSVERLAGRAARIGARTNADSRRATYAASGMPLDYIESGRIFNEEYDRLFGPAIDKNIAIHFRGAEAEKMFRGPKGIRLRSGKVREALDIFYGKFGLDPLDTADHEAFKSPERVINSMKFGNGWVPAPERKMFEDIVAYVDQRTGKQYKITLKPLAGPFRENSGAIIELVDNRGRVVSIPIPFTTPTGGLSIGGDTRIAQVRRVTNKATGEIEMQQLSGFKVMENVRARIDVIFSAMRRGDIRKAQSEATRAAGSVLRDLPASTGTVFDTVISRRIRDESLRQGMGLNIDHTARKRIGRYLTSMERLRALTVEKAWIAIDTETTIRADAAGMQRIWNIAGLVIGPDGKIAEVAPESGFTNPGGMWGDPKRVDPMFQGQFGSKYHHITEAELKTINKSVLDIKAVERIVDFMQDPRHRGMAIVVHNRDFDIPLIKEIYKRRATPTRPGQSVVPFEALESRIIDTYDIATGFIDKSRVHGYGQEGIIRGFASLYPDLPQDYREAHLAFKDAADLDYVVTIMQREFKDKSRIELLLMLKEQMKKSGRKPYLSTSEKAQGIRDAYRLGGSKGMHYAMGITAVSSGSAAEGFFNPLSIYEIFGYSLPHAVFEEEKIDPKTHQLIKGKRSGHVIRSSGSIHAATRMPHLTPESYAHFEREGMMLQGIASIQSLKFQKAGMDAMARVTLGGMEEVKRSVGFGRVFPMLTTVFAKDPIFHDSSIIPVDENVLRAWQIQSQYKRTTIRHADIPRTAAGAIDEAAMAENLKKLVRQLNNSGGTMEVDPEIVKRAVINPRDPLVKAIARTGDKTPKFTEKYSGKLAAVKMTDKGLEVIYRLEYGSPEQAKGFSKGQYLPMSPDDMEFYGYKGAQQILSTKWAQDNPAAVFHGSAQHAIRTIQRHTDTTIKGGRFYGDPRGAEAYAREQYTKIRNIMREAGVLVALTEDVPELIDKQVREAIGPLFIMDSPEGLRYLDRFTEDANKAWRQMGLQEINRQQLDETKISIDMFEEATRRHGQGPPGTQRDLYHLTGEIANITADNGGVGRILGPRGMGEFVIRQESAGTAETMSRQMYSAVPITASARRILSKGMRFNPDMMRRFDDLMAVNTTMMKTLGQSAEAMRKEIAPAVEAFKHYVHASSRRVVKESGLFNAFTTTLRMAGLLEPLDGTKTYEWVKGKGWVNSEGTVRGRTLEEVRKLHNSNGFLVKIPTFGKGADFMVMSTDKQYRTLNQQTGGRLYVPGDDIRMLTETKAWGGQEFSHDNYLARTISNLAETIEGGKSHTEMAHAVKEYVQIAASNSVDKHGYLAGLQSGYIGGVLQNVLHAPSADLFFSNIPEHPEMGKIGAPSLHFLNFAKMAPGTVYITETAARAHLGDARFSRMIQRDNPASHAILEEMKKGGFFTPEEVSFAYTAVTARYPVVTPATNIAPVNVVVMKSINGSKDPFIMIGDPFTLKRMQGDHDGDITKLAAPDVLDTHQVADSFRKWHKAAQLSNLEHVMGTATQMEIDLAYMGKGEATAWRGAVMMKHSGGKIYAMNSEVVDNPDGKTFRREIKFYKAEEAWLGEKRGIFSEGVKGSATSTYMVRNAKNAAIELTESERANLHYAGIGLMSVDDGTMIRDLSGGGSGLVKSDAKRRSFQLTQRWLNRDEFFEEMDKRQIMKIGTKIATPEAYIAYEQLMGLHEAVASRNVIADIAETMFHTTVQTPAIAKGGFAEKFQAELRDALWTIAERDSAGNRFTAAADKALYKFTMGHWESFEGLGYTKEAMAGIGLGEGGGLNLRQSMLHARMEHTNLNDALTRGAQPRGGMFGRTKRGGEIIARLTDYLYNRHATNIDEGGMMIREMLQQSGELPANWGKKNRLTVEGGARGLGAESFGQTLDRSLGMEASRYIRTGGKVAGVAGLLYLGLNFFRPNQMGMLGDMPGKGGEVYDTGFSRDEIPRGVPLDIPMYTWESKARVMAYEPGKFAKNMRIQGMLFDRLGIDIATPEAMRVPGVHMTYQSNRSSDPQLQMYLNNAVRGAV